MKRLLAVLLISLLLVCCCGTSCKQPPKCLREECHSKQELIPVSDGSSGFFIIPMTMSHCNCLEYEDAGLKE